MQLNKTRSVSLALMGSVLVAGCASIPFLGKPDPRWADYTSWTKITEGEPSTGNSQALGDVNMGAEGYRDVYVNDVGLAMLTSDGPYDFPEGTVIVKEQFADKADWEAGKGWSEWAGTGLLATKARHRHISKTLTVLPAIRLRLRSTSQTTYFQCQPT